PHFVLAWDRLKALYEHWGEEAHWDKEVLEKINQLIDQTRATVPLTHGALKELWRQIGEVRPQPRGEILPTPGQDPKENIFQDWVDRTMTQWNAPARPINPPGLLVKAFSGVVPTETLLALQAKAPADSTYTDLKKRIAQSEYRNFDPWLSKARAKAKEYPSIQEVLEYYTHFEDFSQAVREWLERIGDSEERAALEKWLGGWLFELIQENSQYASEAFVPGIFSQGISKQGISKEAKFQANCLLLAELYQILGRAIGLDIYTVEVTRDFEGKTVTHSANLLRFRNGRWQVVDIAYGYYEVMHPRIGLRVRGEFGYWDTSELTGKRASELAGLDDDYLDAENWLWWGAIYYNAGMTLKKQGQTAEAAQLLQKAEEMFQRAVELAPRSTGARSNLGSVYDELEKFPEAEAELLRAVALDPKDPVSRYSLGLFYYRQGNVTQAEDAYKKAIEVDPSYALAHQELGVVYFNQGSFQDAFKEFSQAADLDSAGALSRFNLGTTSETLGDLSQAEEWYRQAIRLDPEYALAWHNLGLLYLKQDRLAEAEEALQKAANYDPRDAGSLFYLGRLYQRKNEPDKAIEVYHKAIERDPESVSVWYELGILQAKLKEFSQAEEAFQRVVKLTPDDPGAWHDLGATRYMQDKWEPAQQAFQRALKLNPRLLNTRRTLAWVYYHLKQFALAEQELQQVLKSDPRQTAIWDNLSLLYADWLKKEAVPLLEIIQETKKNPPTTPDGVKDILDKLNQKLNEIKVIKSPKGHFLPDLRDEPLSLEIRNLIMNLGSPISLVRAQALSEIQAMAAQGEESLIKALSDKDPDIQRLASEALGQLVWGVYRTTPQPVVFAASSPLEEKNQVAASSPLQGEAPDQEVGGIDLTHLPAITQQASSPISTIHHPSSTIPVIPLAQLDSEWSNIQSMVTRGIIPSSERIKDYVLSCSQRSASDTTRNKQVVVPDTDLSKVLSCIADILRYQEDQIIPTDEGYKKLLVLLESGKPSSN
ncbi:MAG: tetratricopeptide repeat protein, partial [Deltaproteobacteria bacterium]|nr:tetratricopeptide repeat protein [Deltaproteobacteria bacterium]